MPLRARFSVGLILAFVSTFVPIHVASVEAGWVPIDEQYQTPSLHTVYVDPDSMHREGNLVAVWQLTDYRVMQGNAGFGRFLPGPHRFLSTVTHKQFDCENNRVRLLAFTEFSHHMGTGQPAHGYVDQDSWLAIEAGSINDALWKIAC